MSKIRCKSFTYLGVDGNHLTLAETTDRSAILVSIQQNDEQGRIATVRLSAEQFEEVCRSNGYDGLEVEEPSVSPSTPPEHAAVEP